jgi:hypothetical protein
MTTSYQLLPKFVENPMTAMQRFGLRRGEGCSSVERLRTCRDSFCVKHNEPHSASHGRNAE